MTHHHPAPMTARAVWQTVGLAVCLGVVSLPFYSISAHKSATDSQWTRNLLPPEPKTRTLEAGSVNAKHAGRVHPVQLFFVAD